MSDLELEQQVLAIVGAIGVLLAEAPETHFRAALDKAGLCIVRQVQPATPSPTTQTAAGLTTAAALIAKAKGGAA